jgi:hypothetical protein
MALLQNQELHNITEKLLCNLKNFRENAENRIMDQGSNWTPTHRLRLKSISDKMFDLQIELNELT